MIRDQIFELCKGLVAKSAIKVIDGETQIVGKYCRVAPLEGGGWDVWICNPENLEEGLHQLRVNNIVARLEKFCKKGGVTVLKGEAYTQALPLAVILEILLLLGIRRAAQLSPEVRKARSERMRKIRRREA